MDLSRSARALLGLGVRFTKMHGLGNDYLYLDALAEPGLAARRDLHSLARAMSDRHRGAGADGVIMLCAPADPDHADVRMRVLNADGSDGGICGNGTRCAAAWLVDRGYAASAQVIRIDAGPRVLEASVLAPLSGPERRASVRVRMGPASFELGRIPVDPSFVREIEPGDGGAPGLYKVDHRAACFVSMGNPHMIVFMEEPIDLVPLHDEGPKFETHPAFPQRINVHFVNVVSRHALSMRHWERGAGITQACASGACAAAAAACARGYVEPRVTITMPGGSLVVERDADDISMTGEAVEVFSGDWPG